MTGSESHAQPIAFIVLAETAAKLAKDQVEQEMKAWCQAVNDRLDPHESLSKLILVQEPWSIENGMLTPTLKLKRATVDEKYRSLVEASFRDKATVLWESKIENQKQSPAA